MCHGALGLVKKQLPRAPRHFSLCAFVFAARLFYFYVCMFVVAWFTPLFVAFDVFFKEYIYVCLSLLFLFVSIVLLAFCVLFRVLSIWLFYLICSCLALCHHLLDLALSFSRFFVFQTQRILVVVLCCFVVVVFACVVSGRPCSHCVLCLCFLLCFYGFLRLWTFNGIILRLLCSS